MTLKRAILNIADTGALESTTLMLQAAGYYCARPNPSLLKQIRQCGCEVVYSVEELVANWGYDYPFLNDLASPEEMRVCDLFVDVKAHVNYPRLVNQWPRLEGRVLWCCLNGGDPMKRTDGLPWANPPCPVLTNNMWYKDDLSEIQSWQTTTRKTVILADAPWQGRAYSCYPPYARLDEHKRTGMYGPPICLVHNVARWGYGNLAKPFEELGGVCYGGGGPEGGNRVLLPHALAMEKLQEACCMVHLKIGDTVGYSIVEAMAAEVPVVVSQFYIDETRLHDLLNPGHTCMRFFPDDFNNTLKHVLDVLANKEINTNLGRMGRAQLLKVMWRPERDLPSFLSFLERNFK